MGRSVEKADGVPRPSVPGTTRVPVRYSYTAIGTEPLTAVPSRPRAAARTTGAPHTPAKASFSWNVSPAWRPGTFELYAMPRTGKRFTVPARPMS